MTDQLSPVQIETKLRSLVNQLTQAQGALAQARDAETDAEVELKRERIRAAHSPQCPKPARGSVTVAEREAWIDEQVAGAWEVHRRAVTAREIAQDHLRTLRDQASVVQSLGSSVRTAYGMAGVS